MIGSWYGSLALLGYLHINWGRSSGLPTWNVAGLAADKKYRKLKREVPCLSVCLSVLLDAPANHSFPRELTASQLRIGPAILSRLQRRKYEPGAQPTDRPLTYLVTGIPFESSPYTKPPNPNVIAFFPLGNMSGSSAEPLSLDAG